MNPHNLELMIFVQVILIHSISLCSYICVFFSQIPQPGRVPMVPLSIPEDDSDDIGHMNKSEMPHASGNLSR